MDGFCPNLLSESEMKCLIDKRILQSHLPKTMGNSGMFLLKHIHLLFLAPIFIGINSRKAAMPKAWLCQRNMLCKKIC